MIYYIETTKEYEFSCKFNNRYYRVVTKDEFSLHLKNHNELYNVSIDYNDMFLSRNEKFYNRKCIFTDAPYDDTTFEFLCENSNDWCCRESWLKLAQYQLGNMKDQILDNIEKAK